MPRTTAPSTRHVLFATLIAAVLAAPFGARALLAGAGQQRGADEGEDYTVRVDVDLVMLNITVLDRDGASIPGLRPEHFRVYENGIPQTVRHFGHEDAPASIGLVLDNSRSMRSNRHHVVNAALQFLRLLDPRDEAFVLHFSDDIVPGLEPGEMFSSDPDRLEEAVRRLRPTGVTRLYDALHSGLAHVDQGRWPRKALIVLSDGGDNGSHVEKEAVEDRLRRSEATVFPIGILDERWREVDPDALEAFAEMSGGQAFFPEELIELPRIWQDIAGLIHRQYTLGYVSSHGDAPGYRDIEVRVEAPGHRKVRVHTREGYEVGAIPN